MAEAVLKNFYRHFVLISQKENSEHHYKHFKRTKTYARPEIHGPGYPFKKIQLNLIAHVLDGYGLMIYTFYSAPQCSHCKRCTSYGISVRLSVRPSHAACQNDGT